MGDSFEKQNYEEFFISGSILRVQVPTEKVVLATSDIVAEDKDGSDVTATVLNTAAKRLDDDPDGSYTDNMLSVLVKAGDTSLSPYKITFNIVTDDDNKYEVDVRMKIVDL